MLSFPCLDFNWCNWCSLGTWLLLLFKYQKLLFAFLLLCKKEKRNKNLSIFIISFIIIIIICFIVIVQRRICYLLE